MKQFLVCEKTDGVRFLLMLCAGSSGESYFVDRKYEFYHTKIAPSIAAALSGTLVDGELVLDEIPGQGKRTTFLIFDAVVRGKYVGDLCLSDRLRVVRGEVLPPLARAVSSMKAVSTNLPSV